MKSNNDVQGQEGMLRYWYGGATLSYLAMWIMWEMPRGAMSGVRRPWTKRQQTLEPRRPPGGILRS